MTFLQLFREKAADEKIEVKSRLNFMLYISDDVENIKVQLKKKTIEVLNVTNSNNAVSEDVLNKVHTFNRKQYEEVTHLNKKICKYFAVNSPNKYENFSIFYEKWEKRRINIPHLNWVNQNFKFMKREYNKMKEDFTNEIANVDTLRTNIRVDAAFAQSLLNNLGKTTASAVHQKMNKELLPIVKRMCDKQTGLIESLNKVISILVTYTDHRITWAEFMIGMRDTYTKQ